MVCLLAAGAGVQAVPRQSAGVADTYREAYDQGFRDGRAAGRQDGQSGASFDFPNKKQFQDANRGFNPQRHDRDVFVVAYRRGFEDGYDEGYGLQEPPARIAAAGAPAPGNLQPPQAGPPSAGGPRTAPAGTLVQVELLDTLSTKYNERGDRFVSRVARDVLVGGRVLIPEGSQILGTISALKRAGRIRGRAQINLRFERLRLLDGNEYPLEAALVDLEARSEERLKDSEGAVEAPGSQGRDARQVGRASGIGALVGVIGGGGKGAGVGAAAGAVAGLATVLVTRGRDAQLEARTQLTVRLMEDVTVEP